MITVIVPTLNEEELIERCLASIAAQVPPPDEILIVDNGSTDRTVEIVNNFIATHPHLNINLAFEEKRGCIAAREKGWRVAQGDYIIHLDADETVLPGWLQQVRDIMARYPELGAFGGTYRFENPPLSIQILQTLFNTLYPRLTQLTQGFPFLTGGMTIVKREVLEKMNGYADIPDDQLEDYYLSQKAVQLGYKTRYFPELYGIHSLRRYHAGGLSAWLKWGAGGIDAKEYKSYEEIR